MSRMLLETDLDPQGCEYSSHILTDQPQMPHDEAGQAAGCFPDASQGGIYLGTCPSLWPLALEVWKPDFAGTPRRDSSVRRTRSLTQIMRLKYKPH